MFTFSNHRRSRAPPDDLPVAFHGLVDEEVEKQRGVLVTVVTLLYCLHVVLQEREDSVDNQQNPRLKAAASWASLTEMTAMVLERTHAVLSALDSINLTKALKAFKP